MSKGNMLMNVASGKLGSMVFYRAKGEQRARTYVKTVANPKSEGQMLQRVQLPNLVALYGVMRLALKNAFTNKKSNQSDYNAFVSRNLGRINVYTPKEFVDNSACVVAPYLISDGILQSIQTTGIGVETSTDLRVAADFTIGAATTIGQLSAQLIARNAAVVAGMQLNYISVQQHTSALTGFPYCNALVFSIVMDQTDARLVRDFMPDYAMVVKDGYIAHGPFISDGAFAWEWSAKDAKGGLQTSKQSLIVTSSDLYQAYSDSAAATRAMKSYNVQAGSILVPENNNTVAREPVFAISSVLNDGRVLVPDQSSPAIAVGTSIVINGTLLDASKLYVALSTSKKTMTLEEYNAAKKPIAEYITVLSDTQKSVSGTWIAKHDGLYSLVIGTVDTMTFAMPFTFEAPDPVG